MTPQESVERKVRNVLTQGLIVAIVGWKSSNHSQFTERISPKRVRFFERLPRELPQSAGIVLFTRFIKHNEKQEAKKWGDIHPIALETGEIKRILWSCRDLLAPVEKEEEKEVPFVIQRPSEPKRPEVHHPPAPETAPPPPKPPQEVSTQVRFADAFLKALGGNPDGRLGKNNLGRIIKQVFGENTNTLQLVHQGWLEPIKGAGKKKVGWYKAGPRLLEIFTEPEPTDPVAKARWIVKHESSLIEEKRECEEKLRGIEARLEKVKQAKELLKQLEDLMK